MSLDAHLPIPTINADSAPYWHASNEDRLVIRRCRACHALHFMPRYICPTCWSNDLEWIESSGFGFVYSYSVVYRPSNPVFRGISPYVIALIELSEGPRLLTNIVGVNALSVNIGDSVEVTFEQRGNQKLPQFKRIKQGC